jgi:hypothetical protein
MKNLSILLVVATVLFSCGSEPAVLKFSSFHIEDDQGEVGIIVSDIGDITIESSFVGAIHEDGTITNADEEIAAKLVGNMLQDKDGNTLILIDENGKMDNGSGVFIEWNEKGELMKGGEPAGMKIEPNKKECYQAASIVLFLHLSFE